MVTKKIIRHGAHLIKRAKNNVKLYPLQPPYDPPAPPPIHSPSHVILLYVTISRAIAASRVANSHAAKKKTKLIRFVSW